MEKTEKTALVDCHAHCDTFGEALGDALRRAEEKGVIAVLSCPCTQLENETTLAMAAKHPILHPCVGLHPVQTSESGEQRSVCPEDLPPVVSFAREHSHKFVAIGEVGLDFQPRICPSGRERDGQREVLSAFVALSRELNLPLNVHSRSAGKPALRLLQEERQPGDPPVLMHAFDGRWSFAFEAAKSGDFYFSVPASIIRSPATQKLVEKLPLSALLIETDSPGLGPVKGEPNEPCNVTISAAEIARIKGVSFEEVCAQTTANAKKLFALNSPV